METYMKGIGTMEKLSREELSIQMETFMKEKLKKIKKMDMERKHIKMEKNIKEILEKDIM